LDDFSPDELNPPEAEIPDDPQEQYEELKGEID
jgi:hypothetical protein